MTCRKVRHLSLKHAKDTAKLMGRRHRDKGLGVYECDECGRGIWHIGHSYRKRKAS